MYSPDGSPRDRPTSARKAGSASPIPPLMRQGKPQCATLTKLSKRPGRAGTAPSMAPQVGAPYGFLLNWRSVIRGSIAAELSTFWAKEGATRMPRTLSAGTPLDSRFPK